MSDFASLLVKPLTLASSALRPHLSNIMFAYSATLLAIFGGNINGLVRDWVKHLNFLIRLLAFIALVAFGYGALTLFLSHLMVQCIAKIDDVFLSPILILAFILLGVLAEEKRHI